MPISNKELKAMEKIKKANEKWLKNEPSLPGTHRNKRGKTWLPKRYEIEDDFSNPESQIYFKD